jgi:hypothetical protein
MELEQVCYNRLCLNQTQYTSGCTLKDCEPKYDKYVMRYWLCRRFDRPNIFGKALDQWCDLMLSKNWVTGQVMKDIEESANAGNY